MLVRSRGAVSVRDVEIGLRESLTKARELARLVQELENDHVLLHHVKLLFFEKEKGLGRIVNQKADHRIVHRIVDRQGKDADARIGEDGAGPGEVAGAVFEEDRKLLLDPLQVRLLGVGDPLSLYGQPADDFLSERKR